jgi:hypothetical protein
VQTRLLQYAIGAGLPPAVHEFTTHSRCMSDTEMVEPDAHGPHGGAEQSVSRSHLTGASVGAVVSPRHAPTLETTSTKKTASVKFTTPL